MKQRKIRRKVDSDDDDNEDSAANNTKPASSTGNQLKGRKKKGASTGPVLSFEDEDCDDTFQVKKTKESRKIKKLMRQAPGVIDNIQEATPAYDNGGCDYSDENLSLLRQNQRFSAPVDKTPSSLEGLELSGDAAESFAESNEISEEMLHENVVENGTKASVKTVETHMQRFTKMEPLDEIAPVKKVQTLPDYLPLEPSRSRTQHTSERDSANVSPAPNSEEEGPGDSEWEDELARRAGVRVSGPVPSHPSSGSAESTGSGWTAPQKNRPTNGATVASVKAYISRSLATLSEGCASANRHLNSTEVTVSSLKDEEQQLLASVQEKNEKLAFLKELRMYASDVVGMLRAKEEMISDLRDAVEKKLRNLRDQERVRRVSIQDSFLKSLRQEGEVITLGGYLPSSEDGIVVEFPTYDLNDEMKIFHKAAEVIVQDVRPEIKDISEILRQFRRFRKEYPDKYKASYIPLSLPQVLEQFVLLDLLPVALFGGESNLDLSTRNWFDPLFDYSTEKEAGDISESSPISDENADCNLLPIVVIRSVLPWMKLSVASNFDPLNRSHMSSCRAFLDQILDFDPTPQQLSPVLSEILLAIEHTMKTLCLPVVKMSTPSSISFIVSQLSCLAQLLENCSMLCGVMSPKVLCKMSWECLRNHAQAAMVKALGCHEGEVYNCVARVCRAVLVLIPSRDYVKNIGYMSNEAVEEFYKDISVPSSAHNALKSLVLEPVSENPVSLGSVDFYRASLLKFLRQVPIMK